VGTVPSAAEFLNAIQFGLKNNIALALEIGNSAAVQICLIQIPVLVAVSAFTHHENVEHTFYLIFPLLNLSLVILSVIVVNYLAIDGRSNYFQGSAMILIYLIMVVPLVPFPPFSNQNILF